MVDKAGPPSFSAARKSLGCSAGMAMRTFAQIEASCTKACNTICAVVTRCSTSARCNTSVNESGSRARTCARRPTSRSNVEAGYGERLDKQRSPESRRVEEVSKRGEEKGTAGERETGTKELEAPEVG